MSQFDNTATILSYMAYKAEKAGVRQAPVIDCSDGAIIDGDVRPLSIAPPVTLLEDSPVDMAGHPQDLRAALLAIRVTLIDGASPVFDEDPIGSPQTFEMEVIAGRRQGETLIVMRLRHASAPL